MSLIQQLTPLNLLEEKEAFFADQSYNPHFIYEIETPPEKLVEHGLPTKDLTDLAEEILQQAYYGRNEADLFMMEGARVSQAEADKKIKHFLSMHHIEKRIQVIWSTSFVSRASVNANSLKLRLPADFNKEGFIGMLYHEIGTHVLRNVNYEQQPWYKRKKKYQFSNYLETEEGLAVLHALLPHTFKSLFIGAIRYLAVAYAQQHSFSQVWRYLQPWVQDPERRWNITLRSKRGLTDTSQPGGFTKDLLYLSGPVTVWHWLKQHHFDPGLLYYGKLSIADVTKAQEMQPDYKPILPSFYLSNPEAYAEQMVEIGSFNKIEQLKV